MKHKDIFDNCIENTAKIGWQFSLDPYNTYCFSYIYSYYEAANTLVDMYSSIYPDLFVFPIFFCYRHYLELLLKNICFKKISKERYIDFINCSSHDMEKIWKEARKLLDSQLKENKLNEIEKVINDFIKLDNYSSNFRYPTNKKNKLPLKDNIIENKDGTQNLLCINLKRLQHNVNLVDEILKFTYDDMDSIY